MSNTNQYIAEQAAVVENPITFTSTTGAASTAAMQTGAQANIQLILDLLAIEGADPDVKRGFLDEMSPSCRITLYKVISDLYDNTVA